VNGSHRITLDAVEVAKVRVEKTIPFRFSVEETLDFGEDTGTPVDMSYDAPAKFTGRLGKIIIVLK
jgi:arylsulfatase